MATNKGGAFGSRKGLRLPPVAIQGNNLKFSNDPAPWFADFKTLHAQATALTTSAGVVMQYVDNAELIVKVNAQAVNTDLKVLVSHVTEFKARLAALDVKTKEYEAKFKKIRLESVTELLNHGEEFQVFMNDWTKVVMFAADVVLDHFRAIGEDIPFVCPFSPGFQKAVGEYQMDAQAFEEARVIDQQAIIDEVAAEDAATQGRGQTAPITPTDESPLTKVE